MEKDVPEAACVRVLEALIKIHYLVRPTTTPIMMGWVWWWVTQITLFGDRVVWTIASANPNRRAGANLIKERAQRSSRT